MTSERFKRRAALRAKVDKARCPATTQHTVPPIRCDRPVGHGGTHVAGRVCWIGDGRPESNGGNCA